MRVSRRARTKIEICLLLRITRQILDADEELSEILSKAVLRLENARAGRDRSAACD